MRLAASVLGWMCACAAVPVASPRVDPEPPPVSEHLLAPLVLSIAHPAAAYNEPFAPAAPAVLGEAVRAAMREAAGTRGEITADPRLDLACRELATVVSRDTAPSAALVEFVLHSHGIGEPAEQVLVAWTAPVADLVIAAIRPQLGDAVLGRVRAGVGTAPAGPVIAILVHATGVDLAATPRALAAHGGFELTATLDPRVWSPQLTITHDDGTIEHPAVTIDDDGRALHAPFACGEHTGRQWIEVDATGLGGPLPRAVVPILCGGTWPSSYAVEPAENVARLAGPSDIERRLTSIINRQRARAALPLLRTDARLAGSARQHAASVRDARAAGTAPDTASPSERLRATGVVPVALLENFLEVDSVGRAAEELLNEAMFRADLESPTTTHVGVGAALDPATGHLFVTITYAEFPRRIAAPAVARCIGDAIDLREGSRVDLPLSRVAQHHAAGLAGGAERAQLWSEIKGEIEGAAGRRFEKVAVSIVTMIDVVEIDPRVLVHGQPVDDIGVGVAQSPRYGAHGGLTWVVVFLAQRPMRLRLRLDGDPDAAARRACLAAATGRSSPAPGGSHHGGLR